MPRPFRVGDTVVGNHVRGSNQAFLGLRGRIMFNDGEYWAVKFPTGTWLMLSTEIEHDKCEGVLRARQAR